MSEFLRILQDKALSRIASAGGKQELFNTSGFTFEKLQGDAPNIAGNLVSVGNH